MLSITNNDKLYKNYQIERHIPESELVARVLKNANIRGIPVSANQVQAKIGGFLSSAENCVLIGNPQKSGYVKLLIYQKMQGNDTYIYMYEIGVSRNQKRDAVHNALYEKHSKDAREGGWGYLGSKAFGIIGSAIVPKSSNKAKLEENEYYQVLLEMVESSIKELLAEPQSSYSTSTSTIDNTTSKYDKTSTQTSNSTDKRQTDKTNYNTTSTTKQNSINYNIAKGEKTYINSNKANYNTASSAKHNNTTYSSSTTNNVKQTNNNYNTTNKSVDNSQTSTSSSNNSNENSGGCLTVIFGLGVWAVLGAIVMGIGTSIGIPIPVTAIIFIVGSIIYLCKDNK